MQVQLLQTTLPLSVIAKVCEEQFNRSWWLWLSFINHYPCDRNCAKYFTEPLFNLMMIISPPQKMPPMGTEQVPGSLVPFRALRKPYRKPHLEKTEADAWYSTTGSSFLWIKVLFLDMLLTATSGIKRNSWHSHLSRTLPSLPQVTCPRLFVGCCGGGLGWSLLGSSWGSVTREPGWQAPDGCLSWLVLRQVA